MTEANQSDPPSPDFEQLLIKHRGRQWRIRSPSSSNGRSNSRSEDSGRGSVKWHQCSSVVAGVSL